MLVAIKFETLRAIEGIFVGIHDEIPVAILFLQLELIEGNGDVFFTGPQKSTDTNNGSINFAAFFEDLPVIREATASASYTGQLSNA